VQVRYLGEARRREGEREPRDERGDPVLGQVVRQQVRAQGTQEEVEDEHVVGRLDRVVRQSQHRRGQQRRGYLVVGVSQRIVVREQDVRLEELERVLAQRADIPGERPRLERGIVRIFVGRVASLAEHGACHHAREHHEQDYDDKAYRPALLFAF
jgi:hypothetical protein